MHTRSITKFSIFFRSSIQTQGFNYNSKSQKQSNFVRLLINLNPFCEMRSIASFFFAFQDRSVVVNMPAPSVHFIWVVVGIVFFFYFIQFDYHPFLLLFSILDFSTVNIYRMVIVSLKPIQSDQQILLCFVNIDRLDAKLCKLKCVQFGMIFAEIIEKDIASKMNIAIQRRLEMVIHGSLFIKRHVWKFIKNT